MGCNGPRAGNAFRSEGGIVGRQSIWDHFEGGWPESGDAVYKVNLADVM